MRGSAPDPRTALARTTRTLACCALTLGCALLGAVRATAQSYVGEWGMVQSSRVGPVGLAVDSRGGSTFLYIVDQPLGRIVKVDLASGNAVGVWGQTGTGQLEFNSPYGVAIEPSTGDLYVAERGNRRIQRITSTGQFVMGWGTPGAGNGDFASPIGIAADAGGHVYVVDHGNNRVQKFRVTQAGGSWDVQFIKAWGGEGAGNGQFNAPYGLALDPAGNVWVADGGNHRLQKFDPDGNFLEAFGTAGREPGQFVTPVWISFDASGAFYVAETNSDPLDPAAADLAHQRIQKFNPDGSPALQWGQYGEGGGQFRLPFAAVADPAGNVYVSDYYNTRVQKFAFGSGSPGGGGGGGDPDPSAVTRFGNVSSRLRTNGGRPLIAGFVISGAEPKKVLVRAAGPVLGQFGVAAPLVNPSLEVYSGSSVVASNQDWVAGADMSAAISRTGAFSFPAGSLDSALVVTLPPGTYTAQVGNNGGDGIALVEVYDCDDSSSRLINLSTRGFVDVGDAVLVAGFVVNGTEPKRVLIRGVGPALSAFGVAGALSDPALKVFGSGSVLLAQNDSWENATPVPGGPEIAPAGELAVAAAAARAFALPAGGKDAALLVTLSPGLYSAVVSGTGAATGEALVEVYEVP